MKHNKNVRRKRVLESLEAQLKSGKKPEKVDGRTTNKMVDLTKEDITRIKNNIDVLKERVV